MCLTAVWNGTTKKVTLTFDRAIAPVTGGLNLGNWLVSHIGGQATPSSALIAGAVVTLSFGSLSGVTQVQYAPPPFDVTSSGPSPQPAAAFTKPL